MDCSCGRRFIFFIADPPGDPAPWSGFRRNPLIAAPPYQPAGPRRGAPHDRPTVKHGTPPAGPGAPPPLPPRRGRAAVPLTTDRLSNTAHPRPTSVRLDPPSVRLGQRLGARAR